MVLLLLLWLAFSATLKPPGQYADDRHYQDETARPWPDVVTDVQGRAVIDQGAFVTSGDLAAFLCR